LRKVGNNGGGGGSNELVNSKFFPTLPLIYLPGEGTWAEMWRKKRKRQPTNGQGNYKITALPTQRSALSQYDVQRDSTTDVTSSCKGERQHDRYGYSTNIGYDVLRIKDDKGVWQKAYANNKGIYYESIPENIRL
jgi:hypothetical protein